MDPPLPQRKNPPLQKNGKKAVAVISLSSALPRKKARTFVLTFEKLAEQSGYTLYKAENELTSSCVYGCCG